MSRPDDDTPVPDAWLREALRHAPDADAAPPARLSDTILRMGRAAVAPPRAAPPPPSAAARFWAWLARPSVAAGFAGLMVATVAGVLWWGEPLDERGAPREPEVAPPATAPAPAETPAAPAQSRPAAADAAAPQIAKRAEPEAARVAAAPPAPPAPAREEAAPTLRGRSDEAERRAAPTADAAAAKALAGAAPGAALAGRAAASEPVAKPGLSDLRFAIQRRPEAWTWQRGEGERRPVDEALQEWVVRADRATREAWVRGASAGASYPATLRFWRGGVLRVVLMVGPSGMQLTLGGKTESVELAPGQAGALLAALEALGP